MCDCMMGNRKGFMGVREFAFHASPVLLSSLYNQTRCSLLWGYGAIGYAESQNQNLTKPGVRIHMVQRASQTAGWWFPVWVPGVYGVNGHGCSLPVFELHDVELCSWSVEVSDDAEVLLQWVR